MDTLFAHTAPESTLPQVDVLWTADRAIATFLNRWCHRALGDRAAAEQELRELIDLALTSRRGQDLAHDE